MSLEEEASFAQTLGSISTFDHNSKPVKLNISTLTI